MLNPSQLAPLDISAQERAIAPQELWPSLAALQAAIAAQDVNGAFQILEDLVPEWKRGNHLT